MDLKLYEKIREIWKNKPDKSTPVFAEDLMHIEQGIYNNSLNCAELLKKIEDLESRVQALEPVNIVSWSDGTDAEIVAMAKALRDGRISVEDTDWAVGQERTVQLSSIESESLGNHADQTQTLVILHKGGKLLENGQECNFVVGLKNCLAEGFGMNEENTSEGGWDACRMRTGCNEDLIKMFPEDLRPAFVKFQNITADGAGSIATKTSIDLFALAALKEIKGSNTVTGEGELFQFDYYVTSSHRAKKAGDNGANLIYWTRSTMNESGFIGLNSNNNASSSSYTASGSAGISPFGCI